MRYFLLILAVVALVGCGKKPLIADPIVEKAIRKELNKSDLTKAQIFELDKALPKRYSSSNPKKQQPSFLPVKALEHLGKQNLLTLPPLSSTLKLHERRPISEPLYIIHWFPIFA